MSSKETERREAIRRKTQADLEKKKAQLNSQELKKKEQKRLERLNAKKNVNAGEWTVVSKHAILPTPIQPEENHEPMIKIKRFDWSEDS
jgi:hypothetical protein